MRKPSLYIAMLAALLVLIVGGIAGCAFMPQVSAVEGPEREAVLVDAEPLADNLFSGLVAGDYAAFSRDFDPDMKKAMKEKDFEEMSAFFAQRVGQYQSREVVKVELVDMIYVVTYQVVFEKDPAVAMRLSMRENPPLVAGLWFDSPNLRE